MAATIKGGRIREFFFFLRFSGCQPMIRANILESGARASNFRATRKVTVVPYLRQMVFCDEVTSYLTCSGFISRQCLDGTKVSCQRRTAWLNGAPSNLIACAESPFLLANQIISHVYVIGRCFIV